MYSRNRNRLINYSYRRAACPSARAALPLNQPCVFAVYPSQLLLCFLQVLVNVLPCHTCKNIPPSLLYVSTLPSPGFSGCDSQERQASQTSLPPAVAIPIAIADAIPVPLSLPVFIYTGQISWPPSLTIPLCVHDFERRATETRATESDATESAAVGKGAIGRTRSPGTTDHHELSGLVSSPFHRRPPFLIPFRSPSNSSACLWQEERSGTAAISRIGRRS